MSPLLIGPDNAREATGTSWEWVADQAKRLGVPFLGTQKKRVLNASAFLAALEADHSRPVTDSSATAPAELPADAEERMIVRLGLRRRA